MEAHALTVPRTARYRTLAPAASWSGSGGSERRPRAAGLAYRTVSFPGEHRLNERVLRQLAEEPTADG